MSKELDGSREVTKHFATIARTPSGSSCRIHELRVLPVEEHPEGAVEGSSSELQHLNLGSWSGRWAGTGRPTAALGHDADSDREGVSHEAASMIIGNRSVCVVVMEEGQRREKTIQL